MRFEPGQTVVRRGMHPDGRIGTCTAGRVISDDDRGLLMWIDPRAHLIRPTTLDGRPTRSLPYAVELRTPTIRSLTHWHPDGGALGLTPWQWKDEDEFADQTGHPLFWSEGETAEIRAEGERTIALAEAGTFPFDGAYCDFRPDPAWLPSTLPWWWDVIP